MFGTSVITNWANGPIISIKNFCSVLQKLAYSSSSAEAVGCTQAKDRMDETIDTMSDLYGQDFGAKRLAKEIRRNQLRQDAR